MGRNNPFVARPRTELSQRVSGGRLRRERDRILQDSDAFDLDLHAVTGFQVPGPVAPLEFATAGDRPAPPNLARVDRLEPRKEFDHLRERPEGPGPLLGPGILEHHIPVAVPQPLLVVHPLRDRLIAEATEVATGDDARPTGVRPFS